tara:strand:- start:16 stop:450 length:435 start_codon:yes stop_codon:yes gene_type:complete
MADLTVSGCVVGKVAIVTGASSGIGQSVALLLAKDGASVAVVDLDVAAGNETDDGIKAASGQAIFIKADVGRTPQVKLMIERTVKTFGRLDILYNERDLVWECAGDGVRRKGVGPNAKYGSEIDFSQRKIWYTGYEKDRWGKHR